jgi:site-specific recombinase XerD
MNGAADPDDVLRTLAASLGLGPADLHRIAEQLDAPITPTVAEFAPAAIERCGPKTRPSYAVHIRRLVDAHGDRRLDQITTDDLAELRDRIRADVADAKVARAEATGRLLVSGDPDAHGHGAAENFVRAMRFLFKLAVDRRLIVLSPATAVKVPTRPPAPERPLTSEELQEFALVACTTGNDPLLDGLLFEFHRKTAARREGGLNLRICDLDARGGAVTLTEKFGRSRRLPLDADVIGRLIAHAESRGAIGPGDKVFRSTRGTPITRKRYEYLYDRLDAHTTWSGMLDVGIHWVRHTTLDDVRTVADERTART